MDKLKNPPPALEKTIALATRLMAEMEAGAFQQDGFADLSMRQTLYLDTITHLERPSFSALAEALKVTRPSVTAIVGRLIRNGYVQKVQDGEDRRSFHIVLTSKGQKFAQVHQKMHAQVARALIAHLDAAEIDQLAALLTKALVDA